MKTATGFHKKIFENLSDRIQRLFAPYKEEFVTAKLINNDLHVYFKKDVKIRLQRHNRVTYTTSDNLFVVILHDVKGLKKWQISCFI